MSRNSQTNGMDSIGKQVTLGGHSAVEQPADVMSPKFHAQKRNYEHPPKAQNRVAQAFNAYKLIALIDDFGDFARHIFILFARLYLKAHL